MPINYRTGYPHMQQLGNLEEEGGNTFGYNTRYMYEEEVPAAQKGYEPDDSHVFRIVGGGPPCSGSLGSTTRRAMSFSTTREWDERKCTSLHKTDQTAAGSWTASIF